MRDRLQRPEQSCRQFAESGFPRGDAEFREVDLDVVREEIEHTCLTRVGVDKVLLNDRQHGLLAMDASTLAIGVASQVDMHRQNAKSRCLCCVASGGEPEVVRVRWSRKRNRA